MELIPRKHILLHLVDENFLFTDDLKEKYSWKQKYKFNFYPSADKLFMEIKSKPYLFRGINVVILAVNMAKPDKQLSSDLINKCVHLLPDANIIDICNEKELEKGVSILRAGKVLHIVNNENALYRLDNAIKWVLAKTNLDRKQRKYRWALTLFLASLAVSAMVYMLFFYR